MQRVEKIETSFFDWDEAKCRTNLVKSGIDFPDAALALLAPHLESPSPRSNEDRIKAVGIASGRILVVIYVLRDDFVRIISAWPADKNEQRAYRQIFGG